VAQNFGYANIGWTVAVVATVGVICFWQAQRSAPRAVLATSAAH